jgi:hypothetical protein
VRPAGSLGDGSVSTAGSLRISLAAVRRIGRASLKGLRFAKGMKSAAATLIHQPHTGELRVA